MAQAAKANTTSRGRVQQPEKPLKAFIDPATLPKTRYAMRVVGTCMEPEIKEGDEVVIDPQAAVKEGDTVVLFLTKEAGVLPHGGNVWVKRMRLNLFPGLKFPYKAHPDSNVIPIVMVEQLNPPQSYQIDVRHLLAVHKVTGVQNAAPASKTNSRKH